jgi:hypothetical protein
MEIHSITREVLPGRDDFRRRWTGGGSRKQHKEQKPGTLVPERNNETK